MAVLEEYFTSILLLTTTFIAVYMVYRRRNNRQFPPTMPWLPVVGSLPFMGSVDKLPQTLMEKAASLGNVFAFYGGSKYSIVLSGREAIHEAFVKRSVDFAGREQFLPIKKFKLRDKSPGIALRPYDAGFKHIQQQTLSILKDFGFGKRIMEDRIVTEVSQLIQLVKEKKGEAFDCHQILTSCIMNIIHSILFGYRLEPFGSKMTELISCANNAMNATMPELDLIPILWYLPSYTRRIFNFVSCVKKFEAVLDESIDEALTSEKGDDSFVRSFVDSGSELSELTGMMEDLVLGGSDTSTTTLKWSFILLANHPDIQKRLQQEIDTLVPRDRLPTLDDRPKLPYVEASILEMMRFKTLLPIGFPHKTTCDTEVGGLFIPRDTQVIANLYSAHMDPRAWKDPTVFRPERFLDDDGLVTGKELVISFSLGKRSCLGEQLARQELFLFFTAILQQFDIRPPDGQNIIDYEEKLGVTLAPAPFKVRLIPRLE